MQQSARKTSLLTSGPWQEERASAGPSLGDCKGPGAPGRSQLWGERPGAFVCSHVRWEAKVRTRAPTTPHGSPLSGSAVPGALHLSRQHSLSSSGRASGVLKLHHPPGSCPERGPSPGQLASELSLCPEGEAALPGPPFQRARGSRGSGHTDSTFGRK